MIIEQLHKAGLAKHPNGKSWVRIIIEKPFGRDLASAQKLNQTVLNAFDEPQVYRIDHYLGKDTVQNLMVLRFGNGIFEPLWNRNYVDHVQITAAETLGVEQRAAFYETAGATRDMIQSHVLQLTSLVAMEPPAAFDATAVRNEKIKVLQSIRPFTEESIKTDVVRGQYGPGSTPEDSSLLAGYRQEPGVKPDSATETFVAAKLQIDNWRWAGVPFYLRTGKRLPSRVTEIAIQFRRAPHLVFRGQDLATNTLVLNVQPDEGISISFHAKLPGQEMKLKTVTMDFSYQKEFGGGERSAYATLINDCMRGDATLFDRADGVEAAWALVDPILDYFRGAQTQISQTTRRAPGARTKPTNFWSAMADTGGNPKGATAGNTARRARVSEPDRSGARGGAPVRGLCLAIDREARRVHGRACPAGTRRACCSNFWPPTNFAGRWTGPKCMSSGATSAPFLRTIRKAITGWRGANCCSACPFRRPTCTAWKPRSRISDARRTNMRKSCENIWSSTIAAFRDSI